MDKVTTKVMIITLIAFLMMNLKLVIIQSELMS